MEESRGHTINLCLDYIPNIQDYHKCLIKNNLIITSNTYELWQNVCYKKKWYTLTLLLKFHFFYYSIIKIDNYYYFFNSQFLPLKSITLCEIIYRYISLLRTYILFVFSRPTCCYHYSLQICLCNFCPFALSSNR